MNEPAEGWSVELPGYQGPTLGDLVDLLEPGEALRVQDGKVEVVRMALVIVDGPTEPGAEVA